MTPGAAHVSVMGQETVDALNIKAGGLYVDGTFGAGGHAAAMLERGTCRVFAIDRDPAAIARGSALRKCHGDRLTLIEGCFGEMDVLLQANGAEHVDGVALDLGVSSPQIDEPERGFSFRFDGPLDMRMGRDGPSAADVVNTMAEGPLADIIYAYGEERLSRRVAKAIVLARTDVAILTTSQLAEIVRRVVPKAKRGDGIDPATRTFQALRIHVNDELGELDRGLKSAERLLAPGGRLAVISFHSLEDRRVKAFLRARQGREAGGSRHAPPPSTPSREPSFAMVTKKPTLPTDSEIAANPRSRSARLRVAERTAAPAWERAPRS
ncbi:MAG: 16S rRNA (cytosine(1402)-N(4))-methyltransferase RsmH [Alphaproteobacteria bacterium]|nr:16S rRNA (cytosine(1402)-N(4))-methyltransferase RsmH [Alphaproteobacteria bacterium]